MSDVVYCENCDKKFPGKDMKRVFPDIPHLMERLDIGGTVPAGECPTCGALAYPVVKKAAASGQTISFEERIETARLAAEQAFWESVAKAFPEITTGDFSPEATLRWEQAARDAIETWVRLNRPA